MTTPETQAERIATAWWSGGRDKAAEALREIIASETAILCAVLADIRAVTGVGDKPMLSELAGAIGERMGQGWMPIEVDPKDGSMVLLGYLDGNGSFSARTGQWFLIHPKSKDKPWAYAWVCKMADCLVDQRATHWMLLPPTPAQEG